MPAIKMPRPGLSSTLRKPKGPAAVNWRSQQAINLIDWWPCDISPDQDVVDLIRHNTFIPDNTGSPPTRPRAVASSIISGDFCPSFDGVTDSWDSDGVSILAGNGSFTASGWVRVRGNGTGTFQSLLGWGQGAFNGDETHLDVIGSGGLGKVFVGWTGSGLQSTANVYAQGDWFHYCWVRNSAGGANDSQTGNTVYINAVPVAMSAVGSPLTPITSSFRYRLAYSRFGVAQVDFFDLRVYNRALTPAEVWKLWDPRSRWDLWAKDQYALLFQPPTPPPPKFLSSAGGDLVTLNLELPDGLYFVDVGLDPSVSSKRAYSGVSGQGQQARSVGGILTFVMPPQAVANAYRVKTTPVLGGLAVTSLPVINVLARPLFSSTYQLRSALLPSRWNVGPARPEDEPPP